MLEVTEKKLLLDSRYLRMAQIWAENSYCQRRKVGALLVKDKMIISDGFNGTPQGFENICEDAEGNTKSYVLHAEANAITKVAQSNNSSRGATLYVTTSPCIECAKLIIQSGIKRVVFSDLYRLTDGVELLKRAGIECVHLNNSDNGEIIRGDSVMNKIDNKRPTTFYVPLLLALSLVVGIFIGQ